MPFTFLLRWAHFYTSTSCLCLWLRFTRSDFLSSHLFCLPIQKLQRPWLIYWLHLQHLSWRSGLLSKDLKIERRGQAESLSKFESFSSISWAHGGLEAFVWIRFGTRHGSISEGQRCKLIQRCIWYRLRAAERHLRLSWSSTFGWNSLKLSTKAWKRWSPTPSGSVFWSQLFFQADINLIAALGLAIILNL